MAIAMKRDEMAVANPAPSIHIDGMPLDIGAHDMTGRMTGMTSSNSGFKLSVANDMPVEVIIEPVAVRILSHISAFLIASQNPGMVGMIGILPGNPDSESRTASVTDYNAASTVRDCGMITSSAISNTISNVQVGDEFQRVDSVLSVNSIPNYSALPSEPMVDHGTADPKENNALMPGAAKKSSSKMRPGTTNTARCDCGW